MSACLLERDCFNCGYACHREHLDTFINSSGNLSIPQKINDNADFREYDNLFSNYSSGEVQELTDFKQ
jgi:hypothetical protein